jgi:DNA-formamidopyrimidine glycosylase
MAEGPTVARWADQLQALVGERLLEVRAPKRWQERAAALIGSSIVSVGSHGKNLLIELSDGTIVRCHAMMYGSWQIGDTGVPLLKPEARIRLFLRTEQHEATFFSGPVVEFLTPEEARSHHSLSALGPDIMAGDFDREEAWRRMQLQPDLPVAEALLDQTVVAGIGNIWKSEGLYLARLDPRRAVKQLQREEVERLWDILIPLMQESRQTGRIETVPEGRRGPGLWRWVYGRTGRACEECEGVVQMILQGPGRRRTYFCPACQH